MLVWVWVSGRPASMRLVHHRIRNGTWLGTWRRDHSSASSSPTPRRKERKLCGRSLLSRARARALSSRSAFRGDRSRCEVSRRLRSSAAETRATSAAPRREMITTSWSCAAASHIGATRTSKTRDRASSHRPNRGDQKRSYRRKGLQRYGMGVSLSLTNPLRSSAPAVGSATVRE